MKLRKVLRFNGVLGLTLPNEYSRVLKLEWGNYVEVYLKDSETLLVRKHNIKVYNIKND